MQGGDPEYRTSAGQHLLAAAEASAITAMMTNPIWVVKTRVFATSAHDPNAYNGLWREYNVKITVLTSASLKRIYKGEGWRGLYRGSLLALVGVSNGSIQFAAYEDIKRRRIDVKRRKFADAGRTWEPEDEKLVSRRLVCLLTHRPIRNTFSRLAPPNSLR